MRIPHSRAAIGQFVDDAPIPRSAFYPLRRFEPDNPKLRPPGRHDSQLRFTDRSGPFPWNQRLQIIPVNPSGLVMRRRRREIIPRLTMPCSAKKVLHETSLGHLRLAAASARRNQLEPRLIVPQANLIAV